MELRSTANQRPSAWLKPRPPPSLRENAPRVLLPIQQLNIFLLGFACQVRTAPRRLGGGGGVAIWWVGSHMAAARSCQY